MCNLYSVTTNQAAIIALFRVMNRYVGNLPPMSGVFPDYPAPVIRNSGGERGNDNDALGHAASATDGRSAWSGTIELGAFIFAATGRL